jgi:gamma-glutamylputrescine oxidase
MQLSAWEIESFFEPQDVIIIGSGLVGLWSALELKTKHPKLKITILERGFIPTGASTRNAGFACFGSPTELIHDRKLLGEDAMWNIVELRYKGIEKMVDVLKDEVIDFQHCGGFEVFGPGMDASELAENIHWLNKGLHHITGKKTCFTWSNEKLSEFGFSGFDLMVSNKLEGHLHSGKLVRTLLKLVQSAGVQVFTNMEVMGWEQINDKLSVKTNELDLATNQLLICTNAFTSLLLPEFCITPARGQVLLTSPIEGLKMKGTFHFEEGFYYFRDLGNRILLGGARNAAFETETTTAMETSDVVQQKLEQFVVEHILPKQSFTVEQRWSGIMGFTEDKQPVVKRISDKVSVAVSCNGMGVALAPVIAEKVCEMMN